MRKSRCIIFCVFCFLLGMCFEAVSFDIHAEEDVRKIYVSKNGSDMGNGTIENPLGTIEGAVYAARKYRNGNDKRVEIIIREGIYTLKDTVDLGDGFGGTPNAPIVFKGYEGENAILTMARVLPVRDFSIVTDESILKRLPEKARGKVYQYDLSALDVANYGSIERVERHKIETPVSTILMQNGKMMTIAEWPNKAFTSVKEVFAAAKGYKFSIEEDRLKRWVSAEKPYAYGNFYEEWADETFLLKNMNVSERSFETTYTTVHGMRAGGQVRFINLLEELDIPGEFYVNTETGMLYFYPLDDLKDSTITIALTTNHMFKITDSSWFEFENLTFEGTRGCAFYLTNANNNTFRNCEFRNIGQQGMIIKSSFENLIENNYMHDMGKGCVRITDGDKVTLKHGNNVIKNNHFERFSVIGKRYCEAVALRGVGDVLSHNRIHNAAHQAVVFNGVSNVIEYNDFYDCIDETEDGGVIYAGRSWIDMGNIIRYNCFHDLKTEGRGKRAIYCDDFNSGTTIYGNIFANINAGVQIHNSQFTTVKNNIFGYCDDLAVMVINIDKQSDDTMRKQNKMADDFYNQGSIRENYVKLYEKLRSNYKSYYNYYNPDEPAWKEAFPNIDMNRLTNSGDAASPRNNQVTNNVVYNSVIGVASGLAKESGSFGGNYINWVKPPFVDEKNGNFNLTDYSKVEEYFDMNAFPDFKVPKIEEIGIEGEETDVMKPFNLIAPVNGDTNVDAYDVTLCWEDYSGADRYRLIVAKDKNFENIICDEVLYATYKWFRNLDFDETTYYWKVEGFCSDRVYGGNNRIWNSDGVRSFTTAKYEKVDTSEIKELIEKARAEFDSVEEGDAPGEQKAGSKEAFKKEIDECEKTVMSKGLTNKMLNNVKDRLAKASNAFDANKNTETINISKLLKETSKWNGNAVVSGGVAKFETSSWGGYNGDLVKAYNNVKMKAAFDITDIGYTSIGVRAVSTEIEPWLTKEYIFLVKKNVIELQKFNGSKRFFFDVPNTYIKSGVQYDIEFGATSEGDNVRVILKVNGEEVFNYLDTENIIDLPGFFHVYNNGGNTVAISAADEK